MDNDGPRDTRTHWWPGSAGAGPSHSGSTLATAPPKQILRSPKFWITESMV